jgi:drug/metabolite transporter (DMT)-like permease
MKLDATIAGLILVSALIHATWNAIVKSDNDRLMSFGMVMLAGSVIGLAVVPFVDVPRAEAWPWLLGSVFIHIFYYWFLLRAYAHGDLSHVYPIARGLAPLLVGRSSVWRWCRPALSRSPSHAGCRAAASGARRSMPC